MKRIPSAAFTSTLLLLLAPSLRAEFLVFSIRESTAETISHWVTAFAAVVILFALKSSRSKGGQGN